MAAHGDIALVLGGARSGKSSRAEAIVAALPLQPVLIATAQGLDDEMRARIARHQADRDPCWRTVEEPLDLARALTRETLPGQAVMVDCLTVWLSNLMLAGRNVPDETDGLIAVLRTATGPIVLVANEVGLGIVPDNTLARAFRDEAGRLNQRLAALSDLVLFMAAGLPLALKRPPSGVWKDAAWQ